MKIYFSKYQGAGNDFVIIDNRNKKFDGNNVSLIKFLCDRRFGIGGDGLMLLQEHNKFDFEMRYFNSDGPEASMCGNGGRCIVAFAKKLGIIDQETTFMAVDGLHEAVIEKDGQVNLKMIDVPYFEKISDDYFLNTGSPHFVTFSDSLNDLDVYNEGRKIRYNDRFKKEGTNVNFTQLKDGKLTVYTYERGVENETLACGTGITAAALSAAIKTGKEKGKFDVKAKGGDLSVAFEKAGGGFKNIWLKGPATFVFEGEIEV
ncbi:MAG: diaminopimelate epimerase [Prolixibacteraceae bacterium]|nr:diaminopimelate epimerase [Prolixibacteraceae bacterium]MBN2774591.1 diaminopimelate epimerase [Prolixibacteraceae bacterium]